MYSTFRVFRLLLVAVLVGSVPLAVATPQAAPPTPLPVPSTGNTVPDPLAWQQVITGQIEAFRKGDAQAAMGYAGETFKRQFTDPTVFMMSIAEAGYVPIFTSLSHSFGMFTQPDSKSAVQVVEFIGANQQLYEAIYNLSKEADGWRIEGVGLMQVEGTAI